MSETSITTDDRVSIGIECPKCSEEFAVEVDLDTRVELEVTTHTKVVDIDYA